MIAANIKEKQPKLQFLEKLINFLEAELSMSVNVSPSKIVSGQEPERTCYLLQLFSVVATSKTSLPSTAAATTHEQKDGSSGENNTSCGEGNASPSMLKLDHHKKVPPEIKEEEFSAAEVAVRSGDTASTDNTRMDTDKLIHTSVKDVKLESEAINTGALEDDTGPTPLDQEPMWSLESMAVSFDPKIEIKDPAEETINFSHSMRPTTARRRPPRIKEKKDELVTPEENNLPAHVIIEDEEGTDFPESEENSPGKFEHQSSHVDNVRNTKDLEFDSHTAIVQKIVQDQEVNETKDE